MTAAWKPEETILGWGATPSNRRNCRFCRQPIAWVLDTWYRPLYIDSDPSPGGTILIRKNGTHYSDLENPSHYSPAQADLIRQQGYPLYRRHARMCGAPPVKGERPGPVPIANALDRISSGHGS